ncbi:MAG: alpha/beta fold hydrolase [Patescibacteria group bacterium]
MPNPDLVQIKTKDGLTLPGLLYRAPRSTRAVIHLHGNGSQSIFYHNDQLIDLARALNSQGISLLQFNNRGAHYIKKLQAKKGKPAARQHYGMAYEKIKECIYDIEAAVKLLKKHGYSTFYLVGHSTGANKIVVYHYYQRKNPISKYVLLGGGDDTGIYYHLLGKKRFFRLLRQAKRKINSRQGEQIIAELLPGDIFSYQGFYDIANPDGDYNIFPFLEKLRGLKLSSKSLFRHYRKLSKPTLVVYGDQDQYAWGNIPRIVSILKEQKPDLDYKIIKGADHSFSNHQNQLGKVLANWLAVKN